ncbi:MAG: Xaa-Pro peptidase family protein [Verrucomicrobiota bacterium]|nr:Xaa-Pro peptidase family protein [Verrucomicrobiota bacterium]
MHSSALLLAGIPSIQKNLYHRIRFSIGDPAGWIQWTDVNDQTQSMLICRDIEMQRARKDAHVDFVNCPADFPPKEGLSGDRETATAQAIAECMCRHDIDRVRSDRSLSLIYVEALKSAGIQVEYDPEMGVIERRKKSSKEIQALKEAQSATEAVMLKACRMVCASTPDKEGILQTNGEPLTSEYLRRCIDHWLLDLGYSNPGSIVACGPQAADCHALGTGPLITESPVIIDIFPCNQSNHYHGDCTRTAVHGSPSPIVEKAYNTVVQAKQAAIKATKAGETGESVHRETLRVIESSGFSYGLADAHDSCDKPSMPHGTGHGIGLEVHEPPLLDFKGPKLLAGDVITIEPGLYCHLWGGVRSEDMVAVMDHGCESLNTLPDTLDW